MVEIHTHSLNKELIKICKDRIEENLKQLNTGISLKIKQLSKELTDEKTQFDSNLLKSSQAFDQYQELKS